MVSVGFRSLSAVWQKLFNMPSLQLEAAKKVDDSVNVREDLLSILPPLNSCTSAKLRMCSPVLRALMTTLY